MNVCYKIPHEFYRFSTSITYLDINKVSDNYAVYSNKNVDIIFSAYDAFLE